MKRKILATISMLATSAMMFLPTASAEHASADRYRQMFRDGKFYVEYQSQKAVDYTDSHGKLHKQRYDYTPVAVAAENGNRVRRTVKSAKKKFSPLSILGHDFTTSSTLESVANEENLLQDYFEFASERPDTERATNTAASADGKYKLRKFPEALLIDGKYYRFVPKVGSGMNGIAITSSKVKGATAIVLPASQLNSPDLNPDEDWDFIERDLSVPDEIAIFCWDSIYHHDPLKRPAPHFVESSKKEVDETTFDCDTYVMDIKNMNGDILAQWKYDLLYDDSGNLARIQKFFVRNGMENIQRELLIQAFTNEIPATAFEIQSKVKVYAADTGSMNDLLEKMDVVETIGGKKK